MAQALQERPAAHEIGDTPPTRPTEPASAGLRARLRYRFDTIMSRGPAGLVGLLALITVLIVLIPAIIVTLAGVVPSENRPFSFLLWRSLLHTIDPAALAEDKGNPLFLFVMLGVTFGGIFVFSALIGVITTGLDERMQELRRGRSAVIEKDHTLILGWSPFIFTIIRQLVIANENQHRPSIVILADGDKVSMEEEIRAKVGDTKNTRIVCRTGNPLDAEALDIVSLDTARSIIVLPDDGARIDAGTIKCVLAITNRRTRKEEPYHIVAVLQDGRNLEVARLAAGQEAEFVLVDDLISRIAAQTGRQSGLSVVYTELLRYEGDEIYFQAEPGIIGRRFGDVLMAYETSSVIGLYNPSNGVTINPDHDTVFTPGDEVVAISQDDDTVILDGAPHPPIDHALIHTTPTPEPGPERSLILGWNFHLRRMVVELDQYVGPGSTLTLVSSNPTAPADLEQIAAGLRHTTVTMRTADITDRAVLDALDIPSYQHVTVLSEGHIDDVQEADAHSMVTLLHLRHIRALAGGSFTIVSEMRDVRNQELADTGHVDDFIVSSQLISLMLTQISEDRRIVGVFADLFRAEGSEIYLKPAEQFVLLGQPLTLYTLTEAARRQGMVVIGYRLAQAANRSDLGYGVRLNPSKASTVTFSPGDKVIVLAQD